MMRRAIIIVTAVVLVSGCASSGPAPLPAPPWGRPALTDVADVYRTEWQRADNRRSCALLAFDDVADEAATSRRANFSRGWAVAYDTASVRSAFGIAGTGSSAAHLRTPTGLTS